MRVGIFTAREYEVLSLLCYGYCTKEIADTLGDMSIKTVEAHRRNIYGKISADLNRAPGGLSSIGVYNWAMSNGYVEPPSNTPGINSVDTLVWALKSGKKTVISSCSRALLNRIQHHLRRTEVLEVYKGFTL